MKQKILAGISALLCACLLCACGNTGEATPATTVIGTEDTLVSQDQLTPKENG